MKIMPASYASTSLIVARVPSMRDEFAASAVSIGERSKSLSGITPKKLSYLATSLEARARWQDTSPIKIVWGKLAFMITHSHLSTSVYQNLVKGVNYGPHFVHLRKRTCLDFF